MLGTNTVEVGPDRTRCAREGPFAHPDAPGGKLWIRARRMNSLRSRRRFEQKWWRTPAERPSQPRRVCRELGPRRACEAASVGGCAPPWRTEPYSEDRMTRRRHADMEAGWLAWLVRAALRCVERRRGTQAWVSGADGIGQWMESCVGGGPVPGVATQQAQMNYVNATRGRVRTLFPGEEDQGIGGVAVVVEVDVQCVPNYQVGVGSVAPGKEAGSLAGS